MSDGSLSQDEIDALLSGVDSGPGASSFGAKASGGGLSDKEKKIIQEILDSTIDGQGSNLSMMMGKTVSFQSPSIDVVTRDQLLQSIPEEVLGVKIDFMQGITGEHLFVMSKETALKIASLANKEEGIDLDDMAISAVQEVVSTLTGSLVTVFTEKTGNRNIGTTAAEGKFGPKAIIQFPMPEFVKVSYNVLIGDDRPDKLYEIFALQLVKDIAQSASGGKSSSAGASDDFGLGGLEPAGGMGGQAPSRQQSMQQMPQMQQGMGQGGFMPQQGFGGMGAMGMAPQMGMQQQGGFMGMSPPNVQSVQFPNFQQQSVQSEAGNISLIMDVFMEMTVELGRTKKLIREILGFGEGTILELDKLAGEPVDILVNHKLIAKGEVVVIDENFGVRITEIVTPVERISDMG